MAKFLKNIFHTTDRRKAPHYESELEDERSESPQSGTTRHLFISRSGRMRQANKKRHSLTLEIYGDNIQIEAMEKTTSREYHVNAPSHTAPAVVESPAKTRLGRVYREDRYPKAMSTDISAFEIPLDNTVKTVAKEISPEEEIDNAFEILDKS
ncbi:hypothetical protein SFRURICE_002526 [Spodoptera frugiperda]|uniref:SFRICE_012594 n=1 Tax=Spodoptera frugiperda TaxID=7108 RepID=A0A2H1VT22_SPOFR|nr:uncharacterized protein LOC118270262 [Spodoptera frugiperda]KAF9805029.1 hypothetical protein SFRURICE_002526 [Spodoptera frugiperda]